MQLIDQYLSELEAHLPNTKRDDILVELRDDLVEQVHAIAELADRPPSLADQSEVLTPLGHPLKLASSYKARRHLIGPALYPAYLQTLRSALTAVVMFIVLATLALGPVSSSPALAVKGLFTGFFETGLWVAAIVTLAFLALENSGTGVRWYDDWKPGDMQVGTTPMNYADISTNLVSEAFFLLWWNGLILNTWDIADEWALSSIWNQMFWPFTALIGGLLTIHVLVVARGCWPRLLSAMEMLLCITLVVCIAVVLGHQPLVVSQQEAARGPWIQLTIGAVLVFIAAATTWDGVLAYRRLRPMRPL